MKTKYPIYLIVFISMLSCKAQTPVIPILNRGLNIQNAYYKDADNDFDKFVGTWRSTVGTTSLTITFEKKTMYFISNYNPPMYEDFLVGGYIYSVNNSVLVNTTGQLTVAPPNIFDFNILSIDILKPSSVPSCDDCLAGERRVSMEFKDPTRTEVDGLSANLILRYIVENGVEKIQAKLFSVGNIIVEEGETPPYYQFTVPFGEYTLVKIN